MRIATILRTNAKINRCERCNGDIANIYKVDSSIVLVSCVSCGSTEQKEPKDIYFNCPKCDASDYTINLEDQLCTNCEADVDITVPEPSVVSFSTK